MAAMADEELLEATRALTPRIAAAAEQIEADRRVLPFLVEALADAGLFSMLVPRSLAGLEVALTTYSIAMEMLAKADGSTAWCVAQNSGISRSACYLAREGALEVFGAPRAIRSWGNGPCAAVEVQGGYRLNGRWAFGSGSRHAIWLGAQECPIVDADGQPRYRDDGTPLRRTLFFSSAEVEFEDVWNVSGMRGTGSDTYVAKDLFVPERRAGYPVAQDKSPIHLFRTAQIFSIGFASVALGLARAMLDALIDLASAKTPRDAGRPLREQAPVQIHVARCEATYRQARAFLHQTIDEAWRLAVEERRLDLETRILIRLATTSAIERAAVVVDTVYKAAGTTSIFNGSAFDRRFRDMHAVTQHIQGREDHFEPVGAFFMGLEPDMAWL